MSAQKFILKYYNKQVVQKIETNSTLLKNRPAKIYIKWGTLFKGQQNETFVLFLVNLGPKFPFLFKFAEIYSREKKVTDPQAFHFCAQQTTMNNDPDRFRGMEIYFFQGKSKMQNYKLKSTHLCTVRILYHTQKLIQCNPIEQ